MALYFAPETVLPIASAVMAAVGGFLLFFKRGASSIRTLIDRLLRRDRGSDQD